jgi:hypothetical protein
MIPAGVQVYVASMPVDFRKGATGLMALVRDGGADPFDGALYVFRSKRADRIKAVWFDGTGVCGEQDGRRADCDADGDCEDAGAVALWHSLVAPARRDIERRAARLRVRRDQDRPGGDRSRARKRRCGQAETCAAFPKRLRSASGAG